MARPRKLSLVQYREIKAWARKVRALETRKQMAARYGVSIATLDRIIHGYNPWRDSVTEFDAKRSNGELCGQITHNEL